jgi:putative ABC transport system ATP-binding protein
MNNDLYLLKNVSKRYTKGKDNISIFENLSMNIPEGDFVAIMGPSGSGKTTLLNLLGGIDQVSEGSLLFRDQQLDKFSEGQLSKWRARNVGFIFQFYNLIPMLNAAQNVELPLLLTTLSSKERARNVETALHVVGLSDRARHSPKEMSGGQQQRVAIARAIVADPAVLICDEPTGDLDRTTANEILEVLQLLNRELSKTIIMVTHDSAAAKYARRTLNLDKGRFIEETMTHA